MESRVEQGAFPATGVLETQIRRRRQSWLRASLWCLLRVWDQTWLDAHRMQPRFRSSHVTRAEPADTLEATCGRNGHITPNWRLTLKPEQVRDLNRAARAAPIETGWPIASYVDTDEFRPRPRADGIVASIQPDTKESFDYWSIRTNGDFYFLGSLYEDDRQPGQVGQLFFFDTRTIRATEAILYWVGRLGPHFSGRSAGATLWGCSRYLSQPPCIGLEDTPEKAIAGRHPPSSCPPTKSAPWGAQRLGGESPYPLHAIAIF